MSATKLCLLFLLTHVAVPAQEPEAATKPQRPAPIVVTTSFAGGTMAQFVAQLRVAEPKVNIVVGADAATAKLPPIELRAAGLEQALEGACAVADAEFQVRVADFKGGGEPVYSILAVAMGNVPNVRITKPEVATQVFSLNRLTDAADDKQSDGGQMGYKVETILSAIEAGNDAEEAPPVLRYHRASGLLIARGTRNQLAFVKDVLGNLERDVDMRRQQRNLQRAGQAGAAKTSTTEDKR